MKSALSAKLLRDRPHVFPCGSYIIVAGYIGPIKRKISDGDFAALLMKLQMSDEFAMVGDIQDNCDEQDLANVRKLFTDLRPVKADVESVDLLFDSSSGKGKGTRKTQSTLGFYTSPAFSLPSGYARACCRSAKVAKADIDMPIFMQSYDGYCTIQAIWDLSQAYPANVMRMEKLISYFGDEKYKLTSRKEANMLFHDHIRPRVITMSQGATTDLLSLEKGVYLAEGNLHWFFVNKNKIKFVDEWFDLDAGTIARHGWVFTRVLKVDVEQVASLYLSLFFFSSPSAYTFHTGVYQVFKARKRPAQNDKGPSFSKKPCA